MPYFYDYYEYKKLEHFLKNVEKAIYTPVEVLTVEAVKKAEDGSETIVRLYEADGGRVTTRLDFNIRPASATLVTLMEEPLTSLEVDGHSTTIPFGPFEIQSVKVWY